MKRLCLIALAAFLLAGCAATNAAPAAGDTPTAEVTAAAVEIKSADTLSKNGTYTLTGVIDGQVLVTASNVTLILDNASITCADGSAILGDDGDGQKTLQNLTVELVGSSTVSGGEHGIQGKDNLTITGDGSLNVTAVKDGLHAGDTLNFESGTVNVLSSYEGVEAAYVNISGGSLTTHASDDGVNAASDEDGVTPSVTISGGTHFIYANSDGIDSNGTLDITGGTVAVLINAPRDGQTFDADRPATVLPTLYLNGQFAAGDIITVADFEVTLDAPVTAAALVLPGLTDGTAYSVKLNGSEYQTVTATTAVAAGMGAGMGAGFGGGGNRGGTRPAGDMPEWNGEAPPNGQPNGNFGGRGERGNAPAAPNAAIGGA
ncbi:MAG: carbohydrate-binding domain-containing protein [Oscillospiraceae bacterium]|jgi:hypothetical protein|nr:carbohydrate-binding domain-containing protein [Oscillospiraceae bacterium]